METKTEARYRLLNDYTDAYGRVTLRHKRHSDAEKDVFDNENPNLFTGEAAILLALNGLLDDSDYGSKAKREMILRTIRNNQSYNPETREPLKALYSRQPDPVRFEKHSHKLSWDEHNGLMCMFSVIPSLRVRADDIVEYGHKHNWAFIEERPGTDPLKNAGGRLGTFFRKLKQLYNKEIEPHDEKILADMARIRQPRDRAFYKMVSTKYNPYIHEVISLIVASILTSRKEGGNTSGKIMAWCRFKAIDIVGYKHWLYTPLLKWAYNKFMANIDKTYGANALEKAFKIYFHQDECAHPFHTLIKGLR